MRLIDADALKKKATMLAKELRPMVSSHCMGVTVWDVNAEPTVDAVPVVRCKDCKHYVLHALACRHENFNGIINMNGFCSYGERKE